MAARGAWAAVGPPSRRPASAAHTRNERPKMKMKELRLRVQPGDLRAVALFLAILGALVVFLVTVGEFPSYKSQFGPDWECFNPGHGEEVCVKRPPQNQR